MYPFLQFSRAFSTRHQATFLLLASSLVGITVCDPVSARPVQPPAPTTPISGPPGLVPQNSSINPGFTDDNDVVGSQNPSGTANYSVGFFFDSKSSTNNIVNALAVSAQANVPWTQPYIVSLYSFTVDPLTSITTYSAPPLAQLTFNPGDPNLIPTDDNFDGLIDNYWLSLPIPVQLPITDLSVDPDDLFGYAIAQSGNFNAPDGNFIEQDGTITFNPNLEYLGSGFNDAIDPDYPFPAFPAFTDPDDPNSPPVYGYWNPNLSLVPGPLPVLGAAAGFGWTRRLRKRIRASK